MCLFQTSANTKGLFCTNSIKSDNHTLKFPLINLKFSYRDLQFVGSNYFSKSGQRTRLGESSVWASYENQMFCIWRIHAYNMIFYRKKYGYTCILEYIKLIYII